jgi:hypothetical protein
VFCHPELVPCLSESGSDWFQTAILWRVSGSLFVRSVILSLTQDLSIKIKYKKNPAKMPDF